MRRQLETELLDEVPAHVPAAQHSRRDLRRINLCMGNARLVAANTSEACTYLWKLHQSGKLQLDLKPVNAVLGFTNMLMKLLADAKAETVAVIFCVTWKFVHLV